MVCNNISTLTNLQVLREEHPVVDVAKTQGPHAEEKTTPKKKTKQNRRMGI